MSCSIGVANLPRNGAVDLGDAFATADEALYQAKDNRRPRLEDRAAIDQQVIL